MIKLYNYYRSSASYRVRIALHWKGLEFQYLPIHLTKDGGQQNMAEYRKINPMGHVPALDHDGFLITESMAIIQYLDDAFPERRLFPAGPREKSQVLQLCEIINSGIQPLQNLKVQQWLEGQYALSKAQSDEFVRHWIDDGFKNLEKFLENCAGEYCFGGQVTAADCFLVPQCLTARRFKVAVENYPILARVSANAMKVAAFQKAHPEKQPDFQA